MKILKIIGAIVMIAIIAFVAMALSASPEGSIESSIVIDAPPEMVYEECVDIKKMDAWSPWHNLEPSAFTYEGPASGVGARSVWSSENPELGNGSLEIIEAVPNKSLKTKMVFEGFNGQFYSWVKLEPQDENKTEVVWGYNYSDLDLIGRFFMSIMDINEEMTPKFEEGLADLKEIVESKPTPEPEMSEEMMESDSTAMDSTVMEK